MSYENAATAKKIMADLEDVGKNKEPDDCRVTGIMHWIVKRCLSFGYGFQSYPNEKRFIVIINNNKVTHDYSTREGIDAAYTFWNGLEDMRRVKESQEQQAQAA